MAAEDDRIASRELVLGAVEGTEPTGEVLLKSAISVAWLSMNADSRIIDAFREAWKPLAEQSEWRRWSANNLQSRGAVLILSVRDDLDSRKFRKTRDGVSAHVPFSEVAAADGRGELHGFYRELIRAVYVKWAEGRALPEPPKLPKP